jgi:hypothetical protein
MDELEQKIMDIMSDPNMDKNNLSIIKEFIDKCSLSDFEILKDIRWEIAWDDVFTTQDT